MRRAAFVKANRKRWKEFETLIESPKPDPDKLSDLFIQVTDDLSYANTQYPDTDTSEYLNQLATKVHLAIYKNKKEDKSRLITFWTRELPLLFYEHRWKLLYSFLIFLFASLLGALSGANDVDFARVILSDRYVDMTLKNIEEGNAMGVYASASSESMFFAITRNNILVSMMVVMWGGFIMDFPLFVFLSIGTAVQLIRNGLMLGSFQYFFYEHGAFGESLSTIWIHGTIEISTIVIAGMAGLVSGNALLFPGSYRRIDSFKKGGKDAIKIAIGIVPLFIIAGFLESYVTRLFEMPVILKLLIIGLSLVFMLYYTVFYPRKIAKKHG